MLLNLLNNFCNLIFYFYPLYTIPVDIYTNNLNDRHRKCLANIYKYFTWRKYSLNFLIPFIFLDILLNVLNYKELKKTLLNNNTGIDEESLYIDNNNTNNFDVNKVYDFLHKKSVNDYIILYSIIPLVFIILESLFVILALYYKNIWLKSKKYMIYTCDFAIVWIYLIFLIPLTRLLELSNPSFTVKAYVYFYIIMNLLKEIIPIIYNLFLGIIWSTLNFKILFPKNLYLGQIYAVITNIYFLSIGFILLIFIQVSRNYLISFFILFNLFSILIPKLLYTGTLKYIYTDDEDELVNNISTMRLIFNICIAISFILLFSYIVIGYNIIGGILSINKLFILQFLVKFIYRNIYFKILMGDIILNKLLFIEKQKNINKNIVLEENLNMTDISRELYIETAQGHF